MIDRREFYAANVEEAVAKAADSLGVDRGELSYTVVDEGNSGFLGIGARDARIEVETPQAAASQPESPEADTDDTQEEIAVGEELVEDSTEEDGDGTSASDTVLEPDEEPESVPPDAVQEARDRITTLLNAMDFDARVDVYDAGGYVAADVAPDNTALFIGQKGETIDALQYLVNAAVNRTRTTRVRIILDAEGYRQRRVEALQGMAHRTARKALRERQPIELPPMSPAERRVVHLFLRDNPKVMTESEGTGDARRVRVSPA